MPRLGGHRIDIQVKIGKTLISSKNLILTPIIGIKSSRWQYSIFDKIIL
jgi:hypothetical protein